MEADLLEDREANKASCYKEEDRGTVGSFVNQESICGWFATGCGDHCHLFPLLIL